MKKYKTFWTSFAFHSFLFVLVFFILTELGHCCAAPDAVDTFAQAVAKAEGFGRRGALPTRYHNPGDLKAIRGWSYPGQSGIGKANHVIFHNDAAGWAALRHQLEKIMDGRSRQYNVDMTIAQMGRKYAGFWSRWSKNVAQNLGVDKRTTLRQYFALDNEHKENLNYYNDDFSRKAFQSND